MGRDVLVQADQPARREPGAMRQGHRARAVRQQDRQAEQPAAEVEGAQFPEHRHRPQKYSAAQAAQPSPSDTWAQRSRGFDLSHIHTPEANIASSDHMANSL